MFSTFAIPRGVRNFCGHSHTHVARAGQGRWPALPPSGFVCCTLITSTILVVQLFRSVQAPLFEPPLELLRQYSSSDRLFASRRDFGFPCKFPPGCHCHWCSNPVWQQQAWLVCCVANRWGLWILCRYLESGSMCLWAGIRPCCRQAEFHISASMNLTMTCFNGTHFLEHVLAWKCTARSFSGIYPYGSVASFPVLFDNLWNRHAERQCLAAFIQNFWAPNILIVADFHSRGGQIHHRAVWNVKTFALSSVFFLLSLCKFDLWFGMRRLLHEHETLQKHSSTKIRVYQHGPTVLHS